MASQITVRKLDVNYDPLFGNGAANFISDIDAVTQIIGTRLRLFSAEWWESITDGTPIFQSILGVGGSGKQPEAVALILQQRILGSPYVTGISNLQSSYDAASRKFLFSCNVQTRFGTIAISNQPSNPASLEG